MARPPPAVRLAREAVLQSFELPMQAGLEFERRNYCLTYATPDQKVGLRAFLGKRKPDFAGQ